MPNQSEIDEAIAMFAFRLRRARRDSGELSLRDLAKAIELRGSSSTLQRAFAGTALPSWPVVEALLTRGFKIDPAIVRGEWLPRWVAVKDLLDPLVPPAPGVGSVGDVADASSVVVPLLKPA